MRAGEKIMVGNEKRGEKKRQGKGGKKLMKERELVDRREASENGREEINRE